MATIKPKKRVTFWPFPVIHKYEKNKSKKEDNKNINFFHQESVVLNKSNTITNYFSKTPSYKTSSTSSTVLNTAFIATHSLQSKSEKYSANMNLFNKYSAEELRFHYYSKNKK